MDGTLTRQIVVAWARLSAILTDICHVMTCTEQAPQRTLRAGRFRITLFILRPLAMSKIGRFVAIASYFVQHFPTCNFGTATAS